MTSFECPINWLITEGGSETVQTVKVPSDAPYASRSELMCPNFTTVTGNKTEGLVPHGKENLHYEKS